MTAIINKLYGRLAQTGFEKKFVMRFFPDWWEDSATE
jgi:hypothetical protein